jgi:FlaA1/EpsC-like NDP-sugar epimerase
MVERILVTGASGTVGSEVINQLSSGTADANIRAAAHSEDSVKKRCQIKALNLFRLIIIIQTL